MPDENVSVMRWRLPIAFVAETAAFAEIEHKGAYEHEAKEYDLSLVQQGRG